MRLLLILFFFLGGYGLVTGALAGWAFRGARRYALVLATACVAASLMWVVGWVLWGAGSCGDGCVRDPSIPIASTPFEIVGFVAAAALAWNVKSRRSRRGR